MGGHNNCMQNSLLTAKEDLKRYPSWKHSLHIVDVPREGSKAAFDWLIEQHGHFEFDSSYGPTTDSRWFGPFSSYDKPQHYSYLLNDIDAATLFRLFHG